MNKKILSLTLCSALAASAGAQAASYNETFSVALQTTDLTSVTGATGSIAIGNFAQFDSSLGTLNSVSIAITGQSESTTTLLNSAANTQTFSFSSGLQWAFEILDGDDDLDFAFNQTLSTTGGFVSLLSGDTLDLGTTTASDVYNTTITGADLADFIGAGNVGIGCNTFSSSTTTGSVNITATQSTVAGCSADITYNYTASTNNNVPEPASIALLGIGLAAFGFGRRKA